MSRADHSLLAERADVLAVVAAGGAIGSVGRWGLGVMVPHDPGGFAWSTFTVNVSGALLLGLVMAYLADAMTTSRYLRPFVGVGVLGGWTTFSTAMDDTRALLAAGRVPTALLLYLGGTVVIGLAAVWLGLVAGRLLLALTTRARGHPAQPPTQSPTQSHPSQEEAMHLSAGPALRLTVYVLSNDQWHHRPLHTEIVHRAHRAGLAGASVFHGVEGFGKSETVHTSRILSLGDDLPCAIVIIDVEERVRAFLPQLDELVTEGLVVIEPVEVVRYVSRELDGPR